jgi:exoribonuclease II
MSITPESIVVLGAGTLLVIVSSGVIYRRLPKRLKPDRFSEQWKKLQLLCKDKATWPQALTEADKLLDMALKKRKFKGKTMGERMVSAQRVLTDNDGVWFAHNLYKKVIAEEITRLKEGDVKQALVAYRQALRDIGALKSDQQKKS